MAVPRATVAMAAPAREKVPLVPDLRAEERTSLAEGIREDIINIGARRRIDTREMIGATMTGVEDHILDTMVEREEVEEEGRLVPEVETREEETLIGTMDLTMAGDEVEAITVLIVTTGITGDDMKMRKMVLL